MKALAFNQVTRATLLAAGIDGTSTLKLHGLTLDDGDGERDGEGLLDGLGDGLGEGLLIGDGDGLGEGLGDGLGSLLEAITSDDSSEKEGPPALETVKIFKINF